ncbi:MAG: autotransporter [Planctomycetota bacterium]|nr:MAG: autotransporter [Planctomycetota bacterium]
MRVRTGLSLMDCLRGREDSTPWRPLRTRGRGELGPLGAEGIEGPPRARTEPPPRSPRPRRTAPPRLLSSHAVSSLLLRSLLEAYRAALAPAAARFELAARLPRVAQRARFVALRERARGTAFARDHGLERIRTVEDYQDAVPVRDYAGHLPYLERMLRGERRVLTREHPRLFERTSGSTQASKLIPYPPALFAEFSAATGPWLFDLYTHRPALRETSAYWSISPLGRREARTPGGDPIGLVDDTEYFPPAVRALLRQVLPVPPQVARLEDVDRCRYVTLRYLLADRRLGLVSVWSPSFFTLLIDRARAHADRLVEDIAHGTLSPPGGPSPPELRLRPPEADPAQAEAVRAAFAEPTPDLRRVWPHLRLVSCWTEGAAAAQLPALRALLPPDVEVQGKGLLATEGVVSFPLLGHEGSVLAVAGHLLELRPLDDPAGRPLLPHQVDVGERYQPILSTAGGLYRYPLGDALEVIGRYRRTPRVRFLGRIDGVSDLRGEKLAPAFVDAVLDEALAEVPGVRFRLLAPTPGDPPNYTLYLEVPPGLSCDEVAAAVERGLRSNPHYDYCRRLGQLDPVAAVAVSDGLARYEAALTQRGQRAGDLKPPGLRREPFWHEVLAQDRPDAARA